MLSHSTTTRLLAIAALYMAACSASENASYCDSDTACIGDLFCDIDGVFADNASNTCIDRPEPLACNRLHTCPDETLCSDLSGGSCVECLGNSDCELFTPICSPDNRCVACENDLDCDSEVCIATQGFCESQDKIVYVDQAVGQASDCGTIDKPCASIRTAQEELGGSRNILVIRGGTYTSTNIFVDAVNVVGQGDVVISSFGSFRADTTIRNVEFRAKVSCTAANLALDNVTIRSVANNDAALELNSCITTIVDSTIVDNDTLSAIELRGGTLNADRIAVDRNTGHGIRSKLDPPSSNPSSISISNSSVSNNGLVGIQQYSNSLVLTNSRIQGNDSFGLDVYYSEYSITNNIISGNKIGIVVVQPNASLQKIWFNTFVSNANATRVGLDAAIFCSAASPSAQSNILFGTVTDDDTLISESCAPTYSLFSPGDVFVSGVGNIQADPRFVDIAASDFHLQMDSPAINGGNPFASIETDIDGDLRETANSSPDIGADEYIETQ